MEKEGEMRMERQKGQSMVEFAFILPLFVFIFLAIMYMGMLFADYLSFNDIARSAARYTAINGTTDSTKISTLRSSYKTKYDDGGIMHTNLYTWNPMDEDEGLQIKSVKDTATSTNSVQVTIVLNKASSSSDGEVRLTSAGNVFSFALPDKLTIKYEMYQENNT